MAFRFGMQAVLDVRTMETEVAQTRVSQTLRTRQEAHVRLLDALAQQQRNTAAMGDPNPLLRWTAAMAQPVVEHQVRGAQRALERAEADVVSAQSDLQTVIARQQAIEHLRDHEQAAYRALMNRREQAEIDDREARRSAKAAGNDLCNDRMR